VSRCKVRQYRHRVNTLDPRPTLYRSDAVPSDSLLVILVGDVNERGHEFVAFLVGNLSSAMFSQPAPRASFQIKAAPLSGPIRVFGVSHCPNRTQLQNRPISVSATTVELTGCLVYPPLPHLSWTDLSDLIQGRSNRLMEECNRTIRDVALKEDDGYIPVHEAMLAQIRESPRRPFTSFGFLPFYREAFRVVVLGKSPDDVAQTPLVASQSTLADPRTDKPDSGPAKSISPKTALHRRW